MIDRQAGREIIPAMVADAGDAAGFVWEEFFSGEIRNPHTRRAYRHAVKLFLGWVAAEGFELRQITPGLVGRYLDQHGGSIPTKKLHLTALRGFFDKLVLRWSTAREHQPLGRQQSSILVGPNGAHEAPFLPPYD